MKNKIPLTMALCSAVVALSASASDVPRWKAIVFGQSTDLNFSSNVIPDKIGVNNVTIDGKTLGISSTADLTRPITIESRGGKIANSHDGLTFFYTQLPVDKNFVLKATVTVEQFGPENEAKPAAQEGAGLLVRDIVGNPRQEPQNEGYEEFPAAANMVMNAIVTQDKKDSHRLKLQAISREGITQPWGNQGSMITRVSYKEEIDQRQTPTFRLKLERTNEGFVTAWAPAGTEEWISEKLPRADLISVQNQMHYYVGFFASRNAKITISDASLATSAAQTVLSKPFVAKTLPPVMQIASAALSMNKEYVLQARANEDGTFNVRQNDVAIGSAKSVKAGEMFTLPAQLQKYNAFQVTFTAASGKALTQNISVEHITAVTGNTLYVSPEGKVDGKGTEASPMAFNTAIERLSPGGTIILAEGNYPKTDIPVSASGLKDQPKMLMATGKAVVHGIQLDAHYWHLKGIEITDKSLLIQGSYNLIEDVIAWRNDDTGIQISSPDKIGRPLWASYNRVVNSTSFNNEDPGKINADGFAVKMRVGEGNSLEGCYAYDNIDDGYDLFNKIEDGANGVVVIENSVARNNTSNGFKLGGEGQPVAHEIRNSIATGNHLDGFTDNFNPGRLIVENNISVDNKRFNYIFRQSPYADASTQGVFNNNLSLRTTPGKYDDAVVGNIDLSNVFIKEGRSVDGEGKIISIDKYRSLALPSPLERNADGRFKTGDFLKAK